jgi:hypothetical protein
MAKTFIPYPCAGILGTCKDTPPHGEPVEPRITFVPMQGGSLIVSHLSTVFCGNLWLYCLNLTKNVVSMLELHFCLRF